MAQYLLVFTKERKNLLAQFSCKSAFLVNQHGRIESKIDTMPVISKSTLSHKKESDTSNIYENSNGNDILHPKCSDYSTPSGKTNQKLPNQILVLSNHIQ